MSTRSTPPTPEPRCLPYPSLNRQRRQGAQEIDRRYRQLVREREIMVDTHTRALRLLDEALADLALEWIRTVREGGRVKQ